MVSINPWPFYLSLQLVCSINYLIYILKNKKSRLMLLIITILTYNPLVWWTNTIKESSKEGIHNKNVVKGVKIGIVLFIASEVLFFIRFFWAYFHLRISPDLIIGQKWPPQSIVPFNPINVPLLNTTILLRSGISITWAHHNLLKNNLNKFKITILTTCLLGYYFSILQVIEYKESPFNLTDSSYGSTFFIATGFHGIHVIIGSSFILIRTIMSIKLLLEPTNHTSIEMSAWYWHFVDIVWIYLYLAIYWWGI